MSREYWWVVMLAVVVQGCSEHEMQMVRGGDMNRPPRCYGVEVGGPQRRLEEDVKGGGGVLWWWWRRSLS